MKLIHIIETYFFSDSDFESVSEIFQNYICSEPSTSSGPSSGSSKNKQHTPKRKKDEKTVELFDFLCDYENHYENVKVIKNNES